MDDNDIIIIRQKQAQLSPDAEKKMLQLFKENFEDENWENDDSGNIE